MTSANQGYIFGDFEICPLERETPSRLRRVCVAGADKLVVLTLRSSQPAFRLLSTSPSDVGDTAEQRAEVPKNAGTTLANSSLLRVPEPRRSLNLPSGPLAKRGRTRRAWGRPLAPGQLARRCWRMMSETHRLPVRVIHGGAYPCRHVKEIVKV